MLKNENSIPDHQKAPSYGYWLGLAAKALTSPLWHESACKSVLCKLFQNRTLPLLSAHKGATPKRIETKYLIR